MGEIEPFGISVVLNETLKVAPDYFGSIFKHETGMMVHRYINQIRIKNAELMLQSGSYKVQEVAEHCGFSDVFHFYKQFRALHGFPPSRCIPHNRNVV